VTGVPRLPPRLKVVAAGDRIEADMLGKLRVPQELARPELLMRRAIEDPHPRLIPRIDRTKPAARSQHPRASPSIQ